MWRAFFYAIGMTLILLGAQCLVVDHIVVVNGTRVPGFVARFLEKDPLAPSNQFVGSGNGLLDGVWPQNQPTRFPANSGIVSQTGSQFGPSRFDSQFSTTGSNNSQFGGQTGFGGGPPNQWSQNGNPPFQLAGYGGIAGNPNSRQNGVANPAAAATIGSGGSRLIKPKDWMPWFLLAIGSLVVLYTNSTSRRFQND